MHATPARQSDPLPAHRVREMLEQIGRVSVAVCGDFCLDAYWMLNPRGGEVSAETGLRAQAVGRHYYSLGGAANVVANVAALRPARVRAIGIVGDDIFGRELLRQLHGLAVDTAGMVVQPARFDTVTYGKRYGDDQEAPRIDFGFFNERSEDTDAAVLSHLRLAIEQCDAVIFNQQVPGGLSEAFIARPERPVRRLPQAGSCCATRGTTGPGSDTSAARPTTPRPRASTASRSSRWSIPRCPSWRRSPRASTPPRASRCSSRAAARGILTAADTGLHIAPGIQVLGKTDTVGAGDTVTGALALCLGAGCSPAEAAGFANLAASVTVQKIFQTGTASPEEVIAVSDDADYVYQPELADDIRQAVCVDGTEIEVCCPSPACAGARPARRVRSRRHDQHAAAGLGTDHGADDDPGDPRRAATRPPTTRSTTASRTACATTSTSPPASRPSSRWTRSWAWSGSSASCPPRDILDTAGYKAIYNDALMEVVDGRLAKFRRGELNIDDLTVKGAVPFLRSLRDDGRHALPGQRHRPRRRAARGRSPGLRGPVRRRDLRGAGPRAGAREAARHPAHPAARTGWTGPASPSSATGPSSCARPASGTARPSASPATKSAATACIPASGRGSSRPAPTWSSPTSRRQAACSRS